MPNAIDAVDRPPHTSSTSTSVTPVWDWNGIIGTGQSLSVGATPNLTTTQPYNNLKLSLGSLGITGVPPWEPSSTELSMVPLVEPIRSLTTSYPGPYPSNTYGETPHTCMASQITALARAGGADDYVSVHSVVGESGQGISELDKPATLFATTSTSTTGRAYDATLYEVTAIKRLADAAGKTYGIGAIVMTHGETDSGSSTYESQLIQLLSDYNTELKAITGQSASIPMFMSQQFAYGTTVGSIPVSTQVQWRLGVERPTEFVCTGPRYQYPGSTAHDGVHLSSAGYQLLGEKTGQVYYERVVLGRDWRPLYPESATRSGQVITVNFHVPVPPLAWDEALPNPPDFPNGRGFEVRQGSTKYAISQVEIDGNSVRITCSDALPATAFTLAYAMTAQSTPLQVASFAYRWGSLRDSDPFVGATTQTAQPNYAVHFELTVE